MHKSKNILVTGGAGFVGSHLAKRLLDQGHHVTIMDNLYTGSKKNIASLLTNSNCIFILHDITKPFDGQYDEIYNLACPASPVHYQKDPVVTIKVSVLGILNVLELAKKTGAKVFHTSTSEVYGDPAIHPQKETYWGNVNPIGVRSCYDEGKRVAETFCADYFRQYNMDIRVIRIFNTYGPNMDPQDGRVVSNLIMQALNNQNLSIYGDGSQTRSFQYVSDLIDGIILFMNLEKTDMLKRFEKFNWHGLPILNIGNPDEFTIKSLAEQVQKKIPSSKGPITYKPLPQDDPKQRRPDITMAQAILGWTPQVPLTKGLNLTIDYFRTCI